MMIINKNNRLAAVIDTSRKIRNVQDMLDIFATVQYQHQCSALIVHKESLGEEFFDLKTGYAGELLQKFSNYRMKMAIIGDFSGYNSKSLRDFMFECNQGNCIYFTDSVDKGVAAVNA